ncbi:MAG: hypothetical protein M1822_003268 [Bathelium mastoideum]|nr:MAG: hypothetical protein M1822_003268 [Bathelium mastoideum]
MPRPASDAQSQERPASAPVNESSNGNKLGNPKSVPSSTYSSTPVRVETNMTSETIRTRASRRLSASRLWRMISRTKAFFNEVWQTDIGDARGVNACLDKSRSREERRATRPEVHVGEHDWLAAQAEWIGFSCSNTPMESTPRTSHSFEMVNPLPYPRKSTLALGTEKDKASKEQWQTWIRARHVQSPTSPTPNATPNPSNAQPPAPETAAAQANLAALLAFTRAYHRARLLSTYSVHVPKRYGKRTACTDHAQQPAPTGPPPLHPTWSAIVRALATERALLADWQCRRDLAAFQAEIRAERWWRGSLRKRRGSAAATSAVAPEGPVGQAPATPWLDEMERALGGLRSRVRTRQVCSWVEAFVGRQGVGGLVEHAGKARAELDCRGSPGAHGESLNSTSTSTRQREDAGDSSVEELVERLAFDALAKRLVEDLALLQWAFADGEADVEGLPRCRSREGDDDDDEEPCVRAEVKAAIERVRNEWFTLVFVQEACVLEGCAGVELPARVYKILSRKGVRKVKQRAREMARVRDEEAGANGKARGRRCIWNIEEKDGKEHG